MVSADDLHVSLFTSYRRCPNCTHTGIFAPQRALRRIERKEASDGLSSAPAVKTRSGKRERAAAETRAREQRVEDER